MATSVNKIQTIFEREWNGNRGVLNSPVISLGRNCVANEKLDGTNVRITVRSGLPVRVEKRRNPSSQEKQDWGITEPWYVDALDTDPSDKWIMQAVDGTDFSPVPDGEWEGEAIGPKINGNHLKLIQHRVFLFSLASERARITFPNCPVDYVALAKWLPQQRSFLNPEVGIEGIVWWDGGTGRPVGKIKVKDFKAVLGVTRDA